MKKRISMWVVGAVAACSALGAEPGVRTPAAAPLQAGLPSDVLPPTTRPADIDRATMERATERLRERERLRRAAEGPTTLPTAESLKGAPVHDWVDRGPYSKEEVSKRKAEMLKKYGPQIEVARQQLRRKEIGAIDVRGLLEEKAAVQNLSLERLRDAIIEMDEKNAERLAAYKDGFGTLDAAAKSVASILVKGGTVDSAAPITLNDKSLESDSLRKYFTFTYLAQSGKVRRHDGYIQFGTGGEGLLIPTFADIDGTPHSLIDNHAFDDLLPWVLEVRGSRVDVVHRF